MKTPMVSAFCSTQKDSLNVLKCFEGLMVYMMSTLDKILYSNFLSHQHTIIRPTVKSCCVSTRKIHK